MKGSGEPNAVQLDSGLWVWDFDGIDDYIDVPDANHLDNPYRTVECWANLEYTAPGGTALKIVMLKEAAYQGGFAGDYGTANVVKIQARFKIAGDGWVVQSAVEVQGAWHHLVVTYDGANIRYYIDGTEDAASPQAKVGTIDVNSDALHIGGGVANRYAKGKIGGMRQLYYPLSDGQVLNRYESTKHWFGIH